MTQQLATTLDRVAAALGKAKRVLFVTGAGLSADSGLPTYRGVGGLYEGVDTDEGLPIEAILSSKVLRDRPALTWKYLRVVEQAARRASFNAAHHLIAQLERERGGVLVLTQNVDGLHQRAGSRSVIDIHGDLHDIICSRCRRQRRVANYESLPPLPRCAACGGPERPNVVLFGEALPDAKVDWLRGELERGFDMVVSIGTSGAFPYIRLPMLRAQALGWSSADINPQANPMSAHAEHHLPLHAAEACEALWARLTRAHASSRTAAIGSVSASSSYAG